MRCSSGGRQGVRRSCTATAAETALTARQRPGCAAGTIAGSHHSRGRWTTVLVMHAWCVQMMMGLGLQPASCLTSYASIDTGDGDHL